MLEAIKNRVSRRVYTKEPLARSQVSKIENWITEINKQSGLTCMLLEDGGKAFSSFGKSYGMFKNVRSIIVMKGKAGDLNLKEKVGYYGEELVLRITGLQLGTCWVGGTFDEKSIPKQADDELVCVIPVGNVEGKLSLRENLMYKATHGKVKPISERLSSDVEDLPGWVSAGMEAVLLAPSAVNSQKARFYYEKGTVSADTVNNYRFDMIDLGIAKKHFEIAADGKFEFGNGGVFKK